MVQKFGAFRANADGCSRVMAESRSRLGVVVRQCLYQILVFSRNERNPSIVMHAAIVMVIVSVL